MHFGPPWPPWAPLELFLENPSWDFWLLQFSESTLCFFFVIIGVFDLGTHPYRSAATFCSGVVISKPKLVVSDPGGGGRANLVRMSRTKSADLPNTRSGSHPQIYRIYRIHRIFTIRVSRRSWRPPFLARRGSGWCEFTSKLLQIKKQQKKRREKPSEGGDKRRFLLVFLYYCYVLFIVFFLCQCSSHSFSFLSFPGWQAAGSINDEFLQIIAAKRFPDFLGSIRADTRRIKTSVCLLRLECCTFWNWIYTFNWFSTFDISLTN